MNSQADAKHIGQRSAVPHIKKGTGSEVERNLLKSAVERGDEVQP